MAFWSGETLEQRLPNLVKPFDSKNVDCAAYTLHIGDEYYVSPDARVTAPLRHTMQQLPSQGAFTIPPGQFAFLLTDESVTVPSDAIAFISIKARLKFNGLINISGYHVDPGYHGKLLFSVLNAGPRPIHLCHKQDVFLIWYAELDRTTQRKKRGSGFDRIEPSVVNLISGEILSLQSLSEELNDLRGKTKLYIGLFWIIVALLVTSVVGTFWSKILDFFKDFFR